MEKETELILKEIAIMQAKLDDTKSDLNDIKQENKENFKRILELKDKQSEFEKELQLLKQKVDNLEKHHESDMAIQNKKWDIPYKLLIVVITAMATAVISLILK